MSASFFDARHEGYRLIIEICDRVLGETEHLAQRVAPAGTTAPGDALPAIDIDHFKRINDEHGHAVGDEVLCRVVEAINARKRGGRNRVVVAVVG